MKRSFKTSVGFVMLEERDGSIVRLSFLPEKERYADESPLLLKAETQLKEYFAGERRSFEVPLAPEGTDYQKRVWGAALKIPYGEVRTYRWISEIAGGSPRSAGNALGANPIPIMIPCHRVVRTDGSIGGFSSGTEVKRKLLEIERLHLDESVLK